MKTISCIVLSLLFFSQTFSQTYGEKYDLEFKRFNTCTSGWAEFQRGTALSFDSMMSLNGKIPIKISYNTMDSVPMKFNLNFVIPLPQYKRGEVCTVTVNQKSNLPGKAYFALSSIDENANIVFHDSVWLNNTQWESKLLSFKLNNEKGIRISINYRGNKDSLQSLWLDKVAISIGGKDIAQLDVNRVDKESALETSEVFNKEHIIPLSTENNNCFLPILEQLKDTRIIGLGECTHGSRETKAAFNEFVKSAIQNSKVRLVMIELPMNILIQYNLYIQGITYDNYITQVDRLLSDARYFRYDTKMLAELLDWLRTYNSTSESKVYLCGFDVIHRSYAFSLTRYTGAFLGPKEFFSKLNAPEPTVVEKNKETLKEKLNKLLWEHNYIELICMMENNTLAQKILGKKNIEEYKYLVDDYLGQQALGKDIYEAREFLMAKNIQRAIDLFLEK
ncbi:MAG: hypothetical protein JW842_02975, partial [Prolixibacteraceae bacterium]|nr:hypothetical protein [Prolixibacteraceae bacterium]